MRLTFISLSITCSADSIPFRLPVIKIVLNQSVIYKLRIELSRICVADFASLKRRFAAPNANR